MVREQDLEAQVPNKRVPYASWLKVPAALVPVEEEGSEVLMSSPEVSFLASDCDSSLSLELADLEVLAVQVQKCVQSAYLHPLSFLNFDCG